MKKNIVPILILSTILLSCDSRYKLNANKYIYEKETTIDIYSEIIKKRLEYEIYRDFIMSYRIIDSNDLQKIIDSTIKYSKNPKIMISMFSVESKFNKKAISCLGKDYGIGIGQVSLIGLTDYNWKNGTNYTQNDLYDIETNIKISCWIFDYNENYGVEGLNKKIIAYNEGHVNAKKKDSSKYLDKVLERAYTIGYKGEI